MCLKLWLSFSFHAASAKALMHTEDSAKVMSQSAEDQFCSSCSCVACPISGTGRRGRSNDFEVWVVWV